MFCALQCLVNAICLSNCVRFSITSTVVYTNIIEHKFPNIDSTFVCINNLILDL